MKLDVSTKQGYDIACALRGPDIDGADCLVFKAIFTTRIRLLAGVDKIQEWTREYWEHPGAHIATSAMMSWCADSVYRSLSNTPGHARWHMRTALQHFELYAGTEERKDVSLLIDMLRYVSTEKDFGMFTECYNKLKTMWRYPDED